MVALQRAHRGVLWISDDEVFALEWLEALRRREALRPVEQALPLGHAKPVEAATAARGRLARHKALLARAPIQVGMDLAVEK